MLSRLTPVLAFGLVRAVRPVLNAPALRGPLGLLLAVAGLRAALELAPPATLSRLYIERALAMMLAVGLAWAGAVVVDLCAERWRVRLDPRVHGVSYSVLPLGRQILKLSLFLFAILSVVSAWGYNTSTILAGLGVGGLAVALAAQKTIENLFQLLEVLSSVREILRVHPKVEAGSLPVRFIGVGPYSLDVEVAAYVNTADYDEFLALQQELLLRMLQAVEKAGTALAVPLQESFNLHRAQQA